MTDGKKATEAMDRELIRQAEEHHSIERFLAAAECLKSVADDSLLTPLHRRIIEIGESAAALKNILLQDNPGKEGWKKHAEKHGFHDVVQYYKIDEETKHIVSRIDSLVESSLLNPLLSVMSESDLFHTWMPHYTIPARFGLSESNKLAELSRGQRVVQMKMDMPSFINNRECFIHCIAVDSIEEDNTIVIVVNTLDTGEHFELEIPPVSKGYTRVDYKSGLLIRACPPDYPALKKSKHKYPAGEKLFLVSLKEMIDANVHGVPMSLVNLFTRKVLSAQWVSVLKVAEEIRDGKRTEHQMAIQERKELYEWISERTGVMLEGNES